MEVLNRGYESLWNARNECEDLLVSKVMGVVLGNGIGMRQWMEADNNKKINK